jgi:mycofactocin precursor
MGVMAQPTTKILRFEWLVQKTGRYLHGENIMEKTTPQEKKSTEQTAKIECETVENPQDAPCIIDEIRIEELAIDGICGVY